MIFLTNPRTFDTLSPAKIPLSVHQRRSAFLASPQLATNVVSDDDYRTAAQASRRPIDALQTELLDLRDRP
jgi:hypothetical protein